MSHACHMADFKAVVVVEWYDIQSHARLQGSESECSGVVQYACDMPDFKAVKVSEVVSGGTTCL